ncbi:MAG TPA: hypothetical protein VGX94_18020 [Terriglobia bacterium]|nr:hypothetical protein [Terriglobia bacterium]
MGTRKRRSQWIMLLVLALVFLSATWSFGQQSSQQGSSGSQQNQPSDQSQPAPSLKNPSGAQSDQPAPPAISPAETQAYEAIEKELDPDKQLQLVQSFEKQFPKSVLLSDVYFMAGGAAERKNDVPDALKYGEESLKLQPDNLRSLILVAGLLPLPQALQGTDDQKAQQLTAAEDDANRALQLLPNITRQANIPEDQFDRGKKAIEAQLHSALGMAHLEKAILTPGTPSPAELSQAEQEYKAAVASPQPEAQDYYRLGEVCTRESKWDDAISAFTQAAQLGQGTMIQKYADDMIQKVKAQQAKSPASPPPNPPATQPAKQ